LQASLEVGFNPSKDVKLINLEKAAKEISKAGFGGVGEIKSQNFTFGMQSENGPVETLSSQVVGYSVQNDNGNVELRLLLDRYFVCFNRGYYRDWPSILDCFNENVDSYLNHSSQNEATSLRMIYKNIVQLPIYKDSSLGAHLNQEISLPKGLQEINSISQYGTNFSCQFKNDYMANIQQQTNSQRVDSNGNLILDFGADIQVSKQLSLIVTNQFQSEISGILEEMRRIKNSIFFSLFNEEVYSQYD